MLVRACWIISLLVLPFSARALGLGAISLNSSLDQPLSAEIELLSPGSVELDDIQVSLAGPEAFEKVGLDRPFLLTELRFLPQLGKDGNLYIRVGSRQAIREPYLNFLVEVSWSGGLIGSLGAGVIGFVFGYLLARLINLQIDAAEGRARDNLDLLQVLVERLIAERPLYRCSHCGFAGQQLHWFCPGCKHWGTMKTIRGTRVE